MAGTTRSIETYRSQLIVVEGDEDRPRWKVRDVEPGQLYLEEVDDIMAGLMLNCTPTFQRPLEPGRVKMWAQDMLNGDWVETAQAPLGFTPDGQLVNGQHRLNAVIKAYEINPDLEPIKFWVDYNAAREVFKYIDIGKSRTTGDVLAVLGVKHPRAVGAALRMVESYDRMPLTDGGRSGTWIQRNIPNHDIPDHYKPVAGDIDYQIDDIVRTARKIYFNEGALVAGYFLARRDDPNQNHDDFFLALYDGAGQQTGSPVSKLRDWSIGRVDKARRTATRGTKSLPYAALQLKTLINAYNAWRVGRSLGNISWAPGMHMPTIQGTKSGQMTLDDTE